MIGLCLQKIGGIFILLRHNLAALFFDIATQDFGGLPLEDDCFFALQHRSNNAGGREVPSDLPLPEVQSYTF